MVICGSFFPEGTSRGGLGRLQLFLGRLPEGLLPDRLFHLPAFALELPVFPYACGEVFQGVVGGEEIVAHHHPGAQQHEQEHDRPPREIGEERRADDMAQEPARLHGLSAQQPGVHLDDIQQPERHEEEDEGAHRFRPPGEGLVPQEAHAVFHQEERDDEGGDAEDDEQAV